MKQNLQKNFTAGEDISIGDALYIQSPIPIARDANSQGNSSGTSVTVSHTCTGSNLLLLVGVNCQDGDNVTGVTYNSVAMTQLAKVTDDGSTLYLYSLLNPATGTHDIVATRTTSTFDISVCGSSYTGVAQSGLPDAMSTGTAIATSLTVSLTTVSANDWTFLTVSNGGAHTISGGSGSYQVTPDSAGLCDGFDSDGSITPLSSTSMSVTQDNRNIWGIMVAFAPASGPVTTVKKAAASDSNTSDSFVGFASTSATTGNTTLVNIAGIAEGFAGLTAGIQYYLSDTPGQIGDTAGSNTRKVAITISETELLITNIW